MKIQTQNVPAVAEHRLVVNMSFAILNPDDLLDDSVFKEDAFLESVEKFDFSQYKDKLVLIRGCTSSIIPPWAYMLLTGKLTTVAKTIRFGNEHDNIVVYRNKK